MSNNGMIKLSNYEMINFLSILGISFVLLKHTFLQNPVDYGIITILYSIYTFSYYKLIN